LHSKKFFIVGGILFFLFLLGCRQYHKLQKDIPVYSGARFVKLFKDTSNKQKKHELWAVKASIDDVSKFYQGELADKEWKKEMIVPSPDGNGYALAYIKKDKMLIILVFARAGRENETLIDFSVMSLPKSWQKPR
jgi:hypothetical protein